MNDSELSNRLRAVEQELHNPSSPLQVDGLLVSICRFHVFSELEVCIIKKIKNNLKKRFKTNRYNLNLEIL